MAITLYPWILATKKEKENPVLMNHERIHLIQQKELWILPFYILYFFHTAYLLFRYFDVRKAYILNFFEAESFAHDHNLIYISTRKRFSCFKKDDRTASYINEMESQPSRILDRVAAGVMIFMLAVIILLIVLLSIYA